MKQFIIYFMLNEKNEIIYIGKTTNIKARLSQHFSKIELELNKWKHDINYIKLIYFDNPVDMSIYEIYWINKYNPIHNKQDNYDGYNSKLNLNELFPSRIINIDDLSRDNLINFNFDLSMFDNIIKNKKIELYEDEFIGKIKHSYNYLIENSDAIRKKCYNLLRYKFKAKSGNSSIFIAYPEIVNHIMPKDYHRAYRRVDETVEYLIYIGFATLNSKSEVLNIQYNLFNLLKFISKIKSNNFTLIISCPILKKAYKDYITLNT